jgi:hypothetical protein
MLKIPSFRLLLLSATLAGCEHTALVQQPVRAVPDPRVVQSVTGMRPAELALLLDLADAVPSQDAAGEPWCAQMEHPLDGVAPEQVESLFRAAGIPPQPYLPAGLISPQACPGASLAR